MSLFGKVLAVLNLFALGGFLYMATATLAARKSWAYAVFTYEVALDGLPLDATDVDTQGKPKHLNIDESMSAAVTGVPVKERDDPNYQPPITTQEAYLDHRKEELVKKLDDANVKRPKIVKLAELIAPLLHTVGERELLLACVPESKDPENTQEKRFKEGLFDVLVARHDTYVKSADLRKSKVESLLGGAIKKKDEDVPKLRIAFMDKNKDALTLGLAFLDAHFEEVKAIKDPESKRLAIAQTLAALVDVLPTDEERKKRIDDLKKQPEQREDPAKTPAYKAALGVVGVRTMARALELQAREFLKMGFDAGNLRAQERYHFGNQHHTLVDQLRTREFDLLESKDKLATALAQAKSLEEKAEAQNALVLERTADLEKAREVTAKLYDRVVREQMKLYEVRLRLRDANRLNQLMEQKIKLLEAELKDDE
jgi:hypothetical protein